MLSANPLPLVAVANELPMMVVAPEISLCAAGRLMAAPGEVAERFTETCGIPVSGTFGPSG
jgi:hypothetical protein